MINQLIQQIFNKRPIVAILLSYSFGLIISKTLLVSTGVALILTITSIAILSLFTVLKRTFNPLITLPTFFFIGIMVITPFTNKSSAPNHLNSLGKNNYKNIRIVGEISSQPNYSKKQIKLQVATKKILLGSKNEWQETAGNILLTIKGANIELHKGEEIAFLTNLREPKNFGNPGGFDYEWWLERQAISFTASTKSTIVVKTSADYSPSFISSWRTDIRNFVDKNDFKNSGIMKALLIGEKQDIPIKTRDSFARTGTAHLLAISGLHMGLVAFIFFYITLSTLKLSYKATLKFNVVKLSYILALVPVITYGFLSGFQISALRSAIMVTIFALTLALGRTKDHYNTLSLAALIILILYPTSLWDISFQLSFTAVFFIIYALNITKNIHKPDYMFKFKGLYTLLIVTISASIGTAPITAYYFNMVSLTGVIANLVTVPLLSTLTVPIELLSAITLLFSDTVSFYLLTIADSTISLAYSIITFIENKMYTHIFVSTPSKIEIILFYSLFISTPLLVQKTQIKHTPVILLLSLIITHSYYNYSSYDNKNLRVTFINIGQGDSTLIEIPRGFLKRPYTILVDAGGFFGNRFDSGRNIIAPMLWKKRITHIDSFILTHSQSDHMKGFNFLAEAFTPKDFLWNGRGDLKTLRTSLESNNVNLKTISAESKPLSINDALITFLSPSAHQNFDDMNDNSLVFRLDFKGTSILFTGDITEVAEKTILDKNIDVDILKVPHHGSKYSSTDEFLKSTSPKFAVIPLGRNNSFNFPHREVLDRLNENNIEYFRTDLNGAIEFLIDEEKTTITTYSH